MPTTAEKRATFRALHESGCFVIPNPWDAGSARYLQGLGFKALATTSAGMAWSMGRADGAVAREDALAHIAMICAAADVPVNADFEGGFADDPAGVAESVRLCVEVGVAGLSIEDYTGDMAAPLYDFELAVERIRAARGAIDATGDDVLLTGRCEGFIRGVPDLDEVTRRLVAYSEAGAECLYAPGIRTAEQITAVVRAAAPKPVNLLVGAATGMTVAEYAALGVRRISTGGALARAAWGGFIRTAQGIAGEGSFEGLREAAGFGDIQKGIAG